MSLKKAAACVKKYKSFIISSHTSLEGDALGSELAFYALLKKLGKDAIILNEDRLPYEYEFLPLKEVIKKYRDNLKLEFDCLVMLDCSDLRRPGQVYKINSGNKPVLNIDHHISNQRFGDINWVDAAASSCSEMVFRLYKALNIPFDKESALLLYVGMLTDTGSFRYVNTTSFTHQAVAELLKYGLDMSQIFKNIYENIPFEDLKLLTKILPNIKRYADNKVSWVAIRRAMLKNKKLSFDLTEHILSFARAIKDIEAAVLFKENLGVKNEIRVNFRSQGNVDVNKIASFFAGGGHRTASGCTIHGELDSVIKMVLKKTTESLRDAGLL